MRRWCWSCLTSLLLSNEHNNLFIGIDQSLTPVLHITFTLSQLPLQCSSNSTASTLSSAVACYKNVEVAGLRSTSNPNTKPYPNPIVLTFNPIISKWYHCWWHCYKLKVTFRCWYLGAGDHTGGKKAFMFLNVAFFVCLFLSNPAQCVKIFNIRPYRYLGPVAQGQALGYLLPLQERFSGITSHLALQMCDGTDPSRFIWPPNFISDATGEA